MESIMRLLVEDRQKREEQMAQEKANAGADICATTCTVGGTVFSTAGEGSDPRPTPRVVTETAIEICVSPWRIAAYMGFPCQLGCQLQ